MDREARVARATEHFLIDIVQTRQPIRSSEAFPILKGRIPLLTLGEFQAALLHLHAKGVIGIDDQLRLVVGDD